MLEGNDHRVSLLPHEFAQMVQDIRNVEDAIGRNLQRKMSQGEIMNREILGKSLCINLDLEIGEVIESHMLDVKSPGSGLQPNQKDLVVGKKIGRTLKKGDILYKSDLGNQNSALRTYNFQNRKFGIPIRYHDYNSFTKLTNIDLVEFHLSYKDLEENVNRFFSEKSNLSFLVHAPELFAGDHILDLCSTNETYRSKSIENLSKVVDVTRSLNKWFPSVIKPKIIVNVGGFSLDAPLDRSERADRYEMVLDSLRSLHSNDVEFLPQTMPPFPWHFGGQRFQNLFIDPYEIEQFCKEFNYSVCLDISHSKLACNHFHWSFRKFLELVGPCSSHLHIADSSGVDGEGLQIGDGDIDFVSFGEDIKRYAPNASFIPEIWQGHKEGGEGFWIALDRLESNMN
jgi:N-acetylneuraminate synthase